MSEYTKEQEAEALAWVEKGTFCKLDLDAVLAMAKRTAEAEKERDDLRTQLEAVTRERDSWRLQRDEVHAEMERQTKLKREERQAKLDAMRERDERQKALEVALEERTSAFAERNWANERHDESRADAVRLREALELINAVVVWSDTSREWHLMPRLRTMPALEKVRAALASTPSAEPTPRDMRVAEAVQNAERLRCLRVGSAFINMMSPREPFGCADMSRFARAERDTPTIDLAAVVTKAVKP